MLLMLVSCSAYNIGGYSSSEPCQQQVTTRSQLKDAIDHKLLPTLVKHDLYDTKLELMRLPVQFGGMSFDHPVVDSGCKHADPI